VQEGQSFLAPVPPSASKVRIEAPTGKWKDGLFDCFKYGVLHPHLWCALCCTRLAMAQIMTRMQLTWLGEPGALVATKNTFKVVVILIASYICFTTAIELGTLEYTDADVPMYIVITKLVVSSLFSMWSIYSMCRTRQSVRARYSIPEERCVGYEDCCMSFWYVLLGVNDGRQTFCTHTRAEC
jgi:Cys-rich protein (TIGR01571 family)